MFTSITAILTTQISSHAWEDQTGFSNRTELSHGYLTSNYCIRSQEVCLVKDLIQNLCPNVLTSSPR